MKRLFQEIESVDYALVSGNSARKPVPYKYVKHGLNSILEVAKLAENEYRQEVRNHERTLKILFDLADLFLFTDDSGFYYAPQDVELESIAERINEVMGAK